MRKWLILLLAAAAIGATVWFSLQPKNEFPAGFAVSNGRLELKRIDVATLYPGKVKRMLVDEGDEVAEGQVLSELSSDQSRSRLTAAQAVEQQAKKALQDEMDKLKQANDIINKALNDIKNKNEKNINTKLTKLTTDMFDEFELQYQSSKNSLSESSDIIRKNVGGK